MWTEKHCTRVLRMHSAVLMRSGAGQTPEFVWLRVSSFLWGWAMVVLHGGPLRTPQS